MTADVLCIARSFIKALLHLEKEDDESSDDELSSAGTVVESSPITSRRRDNWVGWRC